MNGIARTNRSSYRLRPYTARRQKAQAGCTGGIGCRCASVPCDKIHSIQKSLKALVDGPVSLPLFINPTAPKQLRQSRRLRSYHTQALSAELKREKISWKTYDKWQTRYKFLQLEKDQFLATIAHRDLSLRAVELDRRFRRAGPDKFSCSEFRTVVRNIQRIVAFEMNRKDCYAKAEFGAFHEKLQDFLKGSKALPYWQVHSYCLHYMMLMDEYEIGLDNPDKQDERKAGMVQLNKLDHTQWIRGGAKIRLDYLDSDDYGVAAEFPHLVSEDQYTKRLIWPSFEPLTTGFFESCACYNIAPLGILKERVAFHDSLLMNRHFFYWHDTFHAFQLPDVEDAHEEKNTVLRTRNCLIDQVTDNALLKAATKYLGFVKIHEDEPKSILDYSQGYEESTRWFVDNISSFGTLPKDLTYQHIDAANTALECIQPYLGAHLNSPSFDTNKTAY